MLNKRYIFRRLEGRRGGGGGKEGNIICRKLWRNAYKRLIIYKLFLKGENVIAKRKHYKKYSGAVMKLIKR